MLQSLWTLCVLLLGLVLFPRNLQAQFPKDCTTKEALLNKECCPLWNGSKCGSDSDRGSCDPVVFDQVDSSIDEPLGYIDYRVNWPHHFYTKVCKCFDNYDGFDCGQCVPGRQGPGCMQNHHVERKEITELTEKERNTFFSNLHKAKYTPSSRYVILTSDDTSEDGNYQFETTMVYDLYVWLHYYASKTYAGTHSNAAHMGPAFPFWHRVFMLFTEREIRIETGDNDFYIPYWNWTRTDHCNICTNTYFGGVLPDGHVDSSSHFSKWTTICPKSRTLEVICVPEDDDSRPRHLRRNPGKSASSRTLPTASDVLQMLEVDEYDTSPYNRSSKHSFRNTLEGFVVPKDSRHMNASLHNLVHDYLNGTMSYLSTAANDPLFVVHHAFVDKLVSVWLAKHRHLRDKQYPRSNLIPKPQRADSYMAPYLPLRKNSWWWNQDITTLGYSFKEMESSENKALGNEGPPAVTGNEGPPAVTANEGPPAATAREGARFILGTLAVVLFCVIVVLVALRVSGRSVAILSMPRFRIFHRRDS